MNRRDTILSLLALSAASGTLRVLAQAPALRRIGVMVPNSLPVAPNPSANEFRKRLAALGWVEGKNLSIDMRYAEERLERFAGFARELVEQKVDVIVASSTPAALAAKAATTQIPIVFALVADPVGAGLVASLGRPGGNLTGVSNRVFEVVPKQIELLGELVPKLERVGFLNDSSNPARHAMLDSMRAACARAGIALVVVESAKAEELEPAFAKAARERVAAMVVPPASLYFTERKRIAQISLKYRMATAHQNRSSVAAGGLVSYGIDFNDGFARAAVYVDKILKGAKPADLPVEQADRFEMVINRSTAKALGLTIPQSVLMRADEVVE